MEGKKGMSASTPASKALNKAYIYTEGSDNRVGMAVLASKNLGANSIFLRSDQISDRAAAFLGLTRPTSLEFGLASKRKWKLAPGMKLLENRESGAYLWTRGDPDDEVDVETRLPGWRIKIEYGGSLVARGPATAAAKAVALLPWWVGPGKKPPREPRIVLCQVIQSESVGKVASKDERLFAIACWAPAYLYSAYEAVFENVLSGLRIYA
jgi:hypothetical protein